MTSLYQEWKFTRWETPVSDVQHLFMVSLVDAKGQLTINLSTFPEKFQYELTLNRYPAYRNILEEYRLELWAALTGAQATGYTLIVADSPWIEELKEHEPLLSVLHPQLRHYIISTSDDVIEILTDEEPIFRQVPLTDTGFDFADTDE